MPGTQNRLTTPHFIAICLAGSILVAAKTFAMAPQATNQEYSRQFGHASNWKIKSPKITNQIFVETIDAGKGLSQIVGNERRFFVASGQRTPDPKDPKSNLNSTVSAFDMKTGTLAWKKTFDSKMSKDQESFGAAGPSAQATPLLIDNKLIHVTFSGELFCLDQETGATLWRVNLVQSEEATPVQFGFSSSPVADPDQPDRFVMLAAGPNAGLFLMNATSGRTIWKAKSGSFSYATPVAATLGGVDQWIVVSRDEVIGISRKDGSELWRQTLAEKGLTNVPTPLVIDNQHILISGQGVKGTRCLEIKRDDQWMVKELWFQRQLQLFYTNWIKVDDRVVLACTDKYLGAVDWKTGKLLGRFRGFGDGNLVQIDKDRLLLIDGKGKISELKLKRNESQIESIVQTRSFPLNEQFASRCWTPLSQLGDRLATRSQNKVALIQFSKSDNAVAIENSRSAPKSYSLESISETPVNSDSPSAFEQILETFQTQGANKAFELYDELREAGKLTVSDRIQLIQTARAEGMNDHASMMLEHALEDFPDNESLQKLKKN